MPLDTLAYIKTRSPWKVVMIFAVGIILPCGVLSYIGLRSYQAEERLMQKETEERYAAVADLVQKKVTKQLTDLSTSLSTLANQPHFQQLETVKILPVLLSPPPLNEVSGYTLFVLNESNKMVAPWQEESLSMRTSSERQELDWGSIAPEVERLERMEFVDKNYAGAIQGYQALQSRTLSPILQATLLENIAGAYRKRHDNRLAEATYLKLAHSYDQVLDLSGYPMGILGRQMTIKLNDQEKDWESALDHRLELYEKLLYRQWKLPSAAYESLLNDLRTNLDRSFLQQGHTITERKQRWDRLRSTQERLQKLEQAGKLFAQNDRADLLRRAYRQGRLNPGTFIYIPSAETQKLALVVPIWVSHTDQRRGLLVGLFSADSVWSTLHDTVAEATQASGLQVEWDRPGLKESVTRRLWNHGIQREIDVMNPPIHFRLMDSGASLHDQLNKRRQWVFAGIIGLSFIVILVGIAIMAQALKREIEVANLKADFVANVSHELRTPLTVISQIEEKLSRGRYRSEDEKKEIYSILGQQTGRLRGLVEEFLDFSKILAGKKVYQSEPLELMSLVQESVDLFEPKAVARGFEILAHYPREPVPIAGDTRAILQSILNLLDNAMKYSGDGREIEVRVTKTPAQGVVAIKDQGIGISKINQEKIFEKFYRIEDKRSGRLESGVGLGLAMIKHVMEGHRGKIVVDSQVGKGSTFSLIFPLAAGGK